MTLDAPKQILLVVFAMFVMPQLMALLPSVDPLFVIMAIFAILAGLQHLGLEAQAGSGASEGHRRPNRGERDVTEEQAGSGSGPSQKTSARSMDELLSEARRALGQNSYKRAAELASQAADLDPESAAAWELLATAQKWQGLRDEAAATLRKALDTYEVDSDKLRALHKEMTDSASHTVDAKVCSEKGDGFFSKRQYDLAFDCYAQALELLKGSEGSDTAASDLLLQLTRRHAECAQQLQDWAACRRSASVLLELDPNDKQALLQRAAANEATEKFKAALDDARKLLSLEPKNVAANRIVHHCQQALRS